MTAAFDKVVGIDYSKAFIDACNTMKGQGTMKYAMAREGELCDEFVAQVDSVLVIILMFYPFVYTINIWWAVW